MGWVWVWLGLGYIPRWRSKW